MPLDKKTEEAIIDITSGRLAKVMKSNMKWASTGVLIGAGLGILIATLNGGSRFVYGFCGGVAVGTLGYIVSPREPQETTTLTTK